MSGGSIRPGYWKLVQMADDIERETLDDQFDTEEVSEMIELLKDLSDVVHDLDYWLSGDYGEEKFLETKQEFMDKWLDKTEERGS